MHHFAVFDVETTGFSIRHHHRIIEIAVVVLDERGDVVEEWETLVNPGRDLGDSSRVHGLSGRDLAHAPAFEAVLPKISSLMRGRVPVAHNLRFDASFVSGEFQRAGYCMADFGSRGLCTMALSAQYLKTSRGRLADCCSRLGIALERAHAAISDARATAAMLECFISSERDFFRQWRDEIRGGELLQWPCQDVDCSHVRPLGRQHAREIEAQTLLHRMSDFGLSKVDSRGVANYRELLCRALADLHLSEVEVGDLVAAAEECGLSRADAYTIHDEVFSAICQGARSHAGLDEESKESLLALGVRLGLDEALVRGRMDHPAPAATQCDAIPLGICLRPGDRVVFTGGFDVISREDVEGEARASGLEVGGSVTKKTKVLVAADTDSTSGKAQKARLLGVPTITYAAYRRALRLLGSEVA